MLISGRFVFKVIWKFEEMRLKEIDRVSIIIIKDRIILFVKDSMRGDFGRYFLILENIVGVKIFIIIVVVIGRLGLVIGFIEVLFVLVELCVLLWVEFKDDGGIDIINYIVEKRESGIIVW